MTPSAGPRAEPVSLDLRVGLQPHPARLYRRLDRDRVQCYLCPRHCTLAPDRSGFCQVRRNRNGELVTLNYGASVQITEEVIETEAVFHFHPGARILSLGNVGCMMTCEFCQNWTTSQARFIRKEDVRHYTPEEVVESALAKGIRILSWTYNDPVVWHEFVMDTARLARRHGLLNLYKSAFYIGPEAVEELREVIDIFSLSLKSMDPRFYARMTKGRLEPVLEAIRQVRAWGDRHLEISNLVVTGANDSMPEVEKVAAWVLDALGDDVPLHFVRFHPAFRILDVPRTDIGFLKAARERALAMGVRHCYLGNVFEPGPWSDTACRRCGEVLVSRFGLRASSGKLNGDGSCGACGAPAPIVPTPAAPSPPRSAATHEPTRTWTHRWTAEAQSGHFQLRNRSALPEAVLLLHDGGDPAGRTLALRPGEDWRFLVAKDQPASSGVSLRHPEGVEVRFWEVLDRAHFPTDQEQRS